MILLRGLDALQINFEMSCRRDEGVLVSAGVVDFLHKSINYFLTDVTFPNDFKKSVVHPTHKNQLKDCKTKKFNYRPITIFTNLSKIYERLSYVQASNYFEKFFNKYYHDFRNDYNAQLCLLVVIEKVKETRDKKDACRIPN